MAAYDTNLAAEFYVMACLHRLGIAASLTLGNKKGVDILVARAAGDVVTVEVKGVAKRYDWPADNIATNRPESHFVVLVCFEGAITDPEMPGPSVWVVPYPKLALYIRYYTGRTNVSRAAITKEGEKFRNAWHFIENASVSETGKTKAAKGIAVGRSRSTKRPA